MVAVVFGREESGLTATEALQCTHACGIPTGRLQPSMNLSHAAAVILARIYEDTLCAPQPHSAAAAVGAAPTSHADPSRCDGIDAGTNPRLIPESQADHVIAVRTCKPARLHCAILH